MRSTIMSTRKTRSNRQGFTLVELLVVIAIIGVLVGLTVPAILAVRGSFDRAANKFEIQALHDAVEKYRSKYGDYPPDGSSASVTEKHLRKAFPNILQSEIALFSSSTSPPGPLSGMDAAEALVFFLGGFSSDSQRPITGKGGPLVNKGTVAVPVWQYNPERNGGFFEFSNNRLTLEDEATFANASNDQLPVFMCRGAQVVAGGGAPYVYFDSRTYFGNIGSTTIRNGYQPSDIANVTSVMDPQGKIGSVRPFLASVNGSGVPAFENPKTFQVIGPGTDKLYGGRLIATGAQWFTSSGKAFTYNGTAMQPAPNSTSKFDLAEYVALGIKPVQDNPCNFVETNTLGEYLRTLGEQ